MRQAAVQDAFNPALQRPEISIATAVDLIGAGLGVVVDVRQPWELECSPVIGQAERLPLYALKAFAKRPLTAEEAEECADGLERVPGVLAELRRLSEQGVFLLCVCRSGSRSLAAIELLHELGCHTAVSMAGGMHAWAAAGHPVLQPLLAAS